MSDLAFGTSGLRGLVTDLVGAPTRRWTTAFLAALESESWQGQREFLVGRDLRSSSPRIAADCIAAASARGWRTVDCGALPTPALALEAARRNAAAIMVTGSHIPDDRNGLKFYRPGEIAKADEAAIRTAFETVVDPGESVTPPDEDASGIAISAYRKRYRRAFAPDALRGMTVGVYQQSTVARDLLVDILGDLGAECVPLARADAFLPVDTEAHRKEDLALFREWAGEGRFTAFVSADGDADRPLVADGAGHVLRGDVLGLLAARFLGCRTVVTPVTSSGAVEGSGVAETVIRTRVGSPFVIAGMEEAVARGSQGVIGFEANGGVLLASPVALAGGELAPLATRDAVLPILCALAGAVSAGSSVRALADTLGAGHALADRLKNIPASASGPFLRRLADDPDYAADVLAFAGPIEETDQLDGVRLRFADGSIVHFRASGNAPELRVYVEASDADRAAMLLASGLALAAADTGSA